MISSCRCDPQLDPEMMAARAHACLLTARDDAVLCSTPCFSCSAVLLFVPISASRLSARECESKSVARSPARSRNAKPAVLRKSLLVVFAVKTFFSSSSGAPQALGFFGGGAKGRGGAFAVLGLAAKAAQCWCRWAPGCAPQGHLAAPQAEIFRAGGRIGRFGGQGGGLGQKMPFVGQPGTPRSRREEHFGIWEVGSIRPSRGG